MNRRARKLLGLAPLLLAGCSNSGPSFSSGNNVVYILGVIGVALALFVVGTKNN